MNDSMKRPFVYLASAIVKLLAICIGLLMLILPVKAGDTLSARATADVLQATQSATSAEVFIVKNSISTIAKITQDDVPKYGCRFSVDPNEIGELLDVITQADIKSDNSTERRLDLRILIRLRHDNDVITNLAFKKFASPGEERVYGFINGLSVSAQPNFPEILQNWATGREATVPYKYAVCP